MIALSDLDPHQEAVAVDDAGDLTLDPAPHFALWLQSLENYRNREPLEKSPKVYLEGGDPDFPEVASLDHRLPKEIRSEGTLVVTGEGKLEADVDVSLAVIDGLFKGKIKATEHVVLENHALVIGEINTPALTIRGGAIIEGRCYFEPSERPMARWERPGWEAFKVGFAKVWRRRFL